MIIILLFWLIALCSCTYAWIFGGQEGRLASSMIIAATVGTCFAQFFDTQWRTVNLPVMAVDVMLWWALLGLVFKSRRYWPIWMAAAQTVAISVHVAVLIVPHFLAKIYAGLSTLCAIPCLLVMAWGIKLDRQASGAKNG